MKAAKHRSPSNGLAIALGAVILALPAWLFADGLGWFYRFDPFGSFLLVLDDFPYLAECRTRSALLEHLWTPHNVHVVPLFRLWTHGLCLLAGNLAALPTWLGFASYAILALVMSATGLLVARETRSHAAGLAAMAGVGITTVMEGAATWFSAGQALWAGFCVLLTLLGLQSWHIRGGNGRWIAANIAALAAPLFWSGGHIAGLAGAAYLVASEGDGRKRVIAVLLGSTLASSAILILVGRRGDPEAQASAITAKSIAAGISHTAQALPEVLVLNNLGGDGITTPKQGVALSLGLAACCAASRRGRGRIRPLEAAGATIVLASFLLVFIFRGRLGYDSLRDLRWYHAIPQIGGVLFAVGWWSALSSPGSADRRSLVLAILIASSLLVLQWPRAQRLFLDRVPQRTTSERKKFPIPSLQRLRAIYLVSEDALSQRRSLARLDRLEVIARRSNLSKASIRRVFGPVGAFGWPATVTDMDALDLLDLPEGGPDRDPSRIAELLQPEPSFRPFWVPDRETWPPPPGKDDGGGPLAEEPRDAIPGHAPR